MNQPLKKIETEEQPDTQLTDEQLFEQEVNRRNGTEPDPDPDPTDGGGVQTPMPAAPAADPLPGEEEEAGSKPVENVTPDKQQVVEEEKPAWYADLDDDAKAAFDLMNTDLTDVRSQYTALHGRLAPMQQANERLRSQVEHAGQRPPAQAPNSSATSGQQPGQQLPAASPTPTLDLGDVPEFAEFKEAFPEEAKAIGALFGRQATHAQDLQQQLGVVSQGLQDIQQASFGQQREQSLNTLAAAHPDWMQVRPSEGFGQWLRAQPASVARMADSKDASECIYVLDRYKQDVWAQRQLENPAGSEQKPVDQSPTKTVRQRREQIRSVPGLEPQGGGIGRPQGNPEQFMSDEEIWDVEVERRLRAQRDRR
ncbi:MAG: hypothetical protein DRH08_01385 [Deltaproteobacteria bacterium]|nr:MAG: hypothetical protein DRH08_01385 [Deltaproteobacteria bacterium]